ncbi:condensation domain-containing protein, partial [Dyadobacter sp. OTU695]|uniref:condensation domain-containing protein n=1 Tax=Dyadobacter sp. OTU695 TaxID=3043860 RepID=UPI00313E7E21
VMFVFQNTPDAAALDLGGQISFSPVGFEYNKSTFDIAFYVTEGTSGLKVSIEYCTDIYMSKSIEGLFGHYHRLLESVVVSPGQPVSQLEMLGAAEREQLLTGFNQTERDYDLSRTVLDLFAGQVKQYGSSVALVFEGQTMSYGELDAASNRLGHYLRG